MRTVLSDFSSSLSCVRDVADFIDSNISTALTDPVIRRRFEFMQCSAMVILSGYFESFLRNLAERCVASICALNKPFVTLPDKIRHAHYELGGRALAIRAKDDRTGRPSRIAATAGDISSRLFSVATNPYNLVWEGFAETQSNPGSENVAEYLKRYGITSPWDQLAVKIGKSSRTLRLQLDSFLYLRNECAHTGTANSIPTPNDIRDYVSFFQSLGHGIVSILEDLVASL
ncbi:MAG TPA: HEPN domain-containing protein [Candidatus Acidoferrum sp.]|nr:HEPN domain-containing protein [Candidatus Acidoferrum sp.]